MNPSELEALLKSLIATWENEVVEFKEAGNDYKTDKIGEYFSGLANEANLRGLERAWLIFGVSDKTRTITGTDYRLETERLQSIKKQITDGTEPSATFRNIHELLLPEGRVVLFEIPAAPRGIPIEWKGRYYGRSNDSLVKLDTGKYEEIRNQTLDTDWSAQIVPQATLDDLDEAAIQKAREAFTLKHANRFPAEEIAGWSDAAFLDRAKITQHGKITRTALLLLGKAESKHLLSPNPAQLTWKLEGHERAYEHFDTPFFLSTTKLYQKIRNIQIRLLPNGQLLPHEIAKYDQKIVLEAMHNCIAHQDYRRNGRINVIEQPDKLIFENEGQFFEGTPDDYVLGDKTPRRYRNSFLVEAMVSLNMIDKMGYGIYDMHRGQRQRYFPMPDYDFSETDAVRMTLYGSVVDPAYSQMLMQKADLELVDVLALDKVQKGLSISGETITRLRRLKLIEGRKPNLHVSAAIAEATDTKAEYIRTRAQDDAHYAKLITDYLEKFGKASRKEIDDLLKKHLSEALDDAQKSRKIGNLLTSLRRSGVIFNAGSRKVPSWKLQNKMQEMQNRNDK